MAWALVTPSSRGLGHALTRHLLLSTPASLPIVATTRSTPTSTTRRSLLASLELPEASASRLDVQACDLSSEASIARLAAYCAERYNDRAANARAHLRLAFCVPGMLVPERAPDKIDYDAALRTLQLNLLAPMLLAKHFAHMLPSKAQGRQSQGLGWESVEGLNTKELAVMAFMSARVGSISDNERGGWFSYRCSKAGLNQLVRSLNIHLRMSSGGRALCVGLHPGTVRTELSREFWKGVPEGKLFEPEYAAERLVNVVNGLGVEAGGRCWDWKGEEIMP